LIQIILKRSNQATWLLGTLGDSEELRRELLERSLERSRELPCYSALVEKKLRWVMRSLSQTAWFHLAPLCESDIFTQHCVTLNEKIAETAETAETADYHTSPCYKG
jgi:hypothetical protein